MKSQSTQLPYAQVALRKSFLPYTGSSAYEDEDEVEEDEGREENVMSRSQTHFSTALFNPMEPCLPTEVATISNRPFANSGISARPQKTLLLEPGVDEQLSLSVSSFLRMRSLEGVSEHSPNDISSDEKLNRREYLGCFRAFLRLFVKDENSVFCRTVEGRSLLIVALPVESNFMGDGC